MPSPDAGREPRLKRLLITGAAGRIGGAMRRRLAHLAETIRLADILPLAPERDGEECVRVDLADADAVDAMVAGCDGVFHLGGIPYELPFAEVLPANIVGVANLYEAVRRHGRPRVLFASSNHTIGFYPQSERLGPDAPLRPDGFYGVSKCFGEALARMYYEKVGQESALVRIGSVQAEPLDRRMLSTWFSLRDFAALAERVFRVPVLGCPVIWGVSANSASWWDNSHLDWLGWTPQDNAETFRERIEAESPSSPHDARQGGHFTERPIG